MRNAFIRTLTKCAQNDPRIVLITADMGFSVFEDFATEFPERFFNVGIAEATMIGMAAGMAQEGLLPVVYSITPFATMRCFEQIRVDVCYQNVPVTIVGVGGGLSYGALGSTHHGIEDISVMRSLPEMTVYAPADPLEAEKCLLVSLAGEAPSYIRLAKNNEPVLSTDEPDIQAGVIELRTGTDIAILSHGPILGNVLKAAAVLEDDSRSVAVYSVPRVKPLNDLFLLDLLSRFRQVVVVEEHSLIGGLSSAVSELIVDHLPLVRANVLRLGIPDKYPDEYGNHAFLQEHFGLNSTAIATRISNWIGESET